MRWLVLLGEADEADAARMPALIKAAAGEWVVVSLLAQRWAELDPQHMFATLLADALTNQPSLDREGSLMLSLFAHWAKADPDAAVAALKEPTGLSAGQTIRRHVSNWIMQSDPARGVKLMIDWKVADNFVPDISALGKWVDENPRAAAEVATAGDLGSASWGILRRIGAAWAASDPAAALAFAAEKRGTARLRLAEAVISEWARRDLKAAVAHLAAEPDAAIRGKLGLPIVESWAAQDPQAALLWANENLKGAARNSAAASVVKTMAAKDIGAAAEFIAGLDEGSARDQSVNQLLRTWLSKDKKEDATAALTWMAALPDADARRQAMEQSSWRLFYAAADETIAFLNSPQGAIAPQQLFDRAAQHLAQKNPGSAMQWAAALPPERRSAAQESVLNEWMSTRPDAAMEWVRGLPKGGQRDASITAATMNLAWQSVDTTRRWLQSLPAADRPAAAAGLRSNGSLSTENRAALEALVK